MKKLAYKLFVIAAGAVLAAGSFAGAYVPASANSAQKKWSGSYSSGAIVTDENCPVVVENELLTFDINEFPSHYYDENAQEFLGYGACVSAKYSFYNPADYTVNMSLAFPFGELPSYAYFYDEQPGDTAKYTITADGEEVERTTRHTFYRGRGFVNETEMGKLRDGYREDSFFSPDMPVVKYTLKFENIVYGNKESDAYFRLSISFAEGARIMGSLHGYEDVMHSSTTLTGWAKNGDEHEFYVLGSTEQPVFDCTFYTNGYADKKTEGLVRVTSVENTNFKNLALLKRAENSSVSETDWYNAVVDYLSESSSIYYYYGYIDVSRNLMRWYEYSLTLGPKGRVVNEVSAPVYPDINGYFSPNVYNYEYYLSPAQSWAEFGKFELVINTPYYIIGSTPNGFEKTEYGYYYSAETLPEGELEFSLCASENPKRDRGGYVALAVILVIIGVVVLHIIGAIICGIVLLIVHVSKKK